MEITVETKTGSHLVEVIPQKKYLKKKQKRVKKKPANKAGDNVVLNSDLDNASQIEMASEGGTIAFDAKTNSAVAHINSGLNLPSTERMKQKRCKRRRIRRLEKSRLAKINKKEENVLGDRSQFREIGLDVQLSTDKIAEKSSKQCVSEAAGSDFPDLPMVKQQQDDNSSKRKNLRRKKGAVQTPINNSEGCHSGNDVLKSSSSIPHTKFSDTMEDLVTLSVVNADSTENSDNVDHVSHETQENKSKKMNKRIKRKNASNLLGNSSEVPEEEKGAVQTPINNLKGCRSRNDVSNASSLIPDVKLTYTMEDSVTPSVANAESTQNSDKVDHVSHETQDNESKKMKKRFKRKKDSDELRNSSEVPEEKNGAVQNPINNLKGCHSGNDVVKSSSLIPDMKLTDTMQEDSATLSVVNTESTKHSAKVDHVSHETRDSKSKQMNKRVKKKNDSASLGNTSDVPEEDSAPQTSTKKSRIDVKSISLVTGTTGNSLTPSGTNSESIKQDSVEIDCAGPQKNIGKRVKKRNPSDCSDKCPEAAKEDGTVINSDNHRTGQYLGKDDRMSVTVVPCLELTSLEEGSLIAAKNTDPQGSEITNPTKKQDSGVVDPSLEKERVKELKSLKRKIVKWSPDCSGNLPQTGKEEYVIQTPLDASIEQCTIAAKTLGVSKNCTEESNNCKLDRERENEMVGDVPSSSSGAVKESIALGTVFTIKDQIAKYSPRGTLPGRSKRKLLVLDINGLLADVVGRTPHGYRPDAWVSGKAVFKRPFCDAFLKFCFEKFDVAIWSSRLEKNVETLVNSLLWRSRHKLLLCWSLSQCTNSNVRTLENSQKPLVFKELRNLWAYLARENSTDPPYDESNTLLLDDSPYKALRNPPYTAVFPHSYRYTDADDSFLGPRGDLRIYLEKLADADNVQKFVKENPFGQPAISESHPSWNFYSKI